MPAIADPDPAAAKRAFEAMMEMSKIDIAVIEAARLTHPKRGSCRCQVNRPGRGDTEPCGSPFRLVLKVRSIIFYSMNIPIMGMNGHNLGI